MRPPGCATTTCSDGCASGNTTISSCEYACSYLAENIEVDFPNPAVGLTYRVYNPEGLTMRQRQEVVEKISYPGVDLAGAGPA